MPIDIFPLKKSRGEKKLYLVKRVYKSTVAKKEKIVEIIK